MSLSRPIDRYRLAFLLIAGALDGFLLSPALAQTPAATQPTQQELLDRINSLQAQVTQLQTHQASADARALDSSIHAVEQDAAAHSTIFDANSVLLQHTETGFKFHTRDGNFSINPWLQLQFRYELTHLAGADNALDNTQNGFELRRLKFGADGNLFGPDLTYFLQFSVNRKTGDPLLELAWAKYHFANTPFSVQFGDIKDPLDHEQIASARYMVAAERTLVDDLFASGEGFAKGVTLIYDNGGAVRAAGSFTGGLNNYNTNFEQYPATGDLDDWGAAARAEYKVFGDWKDYDTHISAHGTEQDTLVFGLGADNTEAGKTGTFTHVLDGQYQTASWLLSAAYLGRYTRDNVVGTGKTATGNDTYDSTLRLQASYALDQHWEPYLQYEYIHFDPKGLAARADDQVQAYRIGTAYYFHNHAAKLTADVSYLPDGSPVSDDGSGVLANSGRSEIIFRAEFQLLL